MAVPMVVIIVIILVIVFMGMSTFQRFQVKATGAASGNLIAFTAAEAGLAAAVAELQASATWATHEVDPSSLGAGKTTSDLAWSSTELDHLNVLHASKRKDDAGITCEIADAQNTGTYTGTVGEGNFKGEFRVRCGRIPYADLPETRSRNEAERFYLIDSMGRHADRAVRIRAIVEASNFTEFVIYDADFLELGMGMNGDPNKNLFANGELYGGSWVKLGNIGTNGTKQEFKKHGQDPVGGPHHRRGSVHHRLQLALGEFGPASRRASTPARRPPTTRPTTTWSTAPMAGGFPAPNLPWDYYESLKDAGVAARVSASSGRPGYEETTHYNPHSGDQNVVVLDFGKNEGCEPMTASGDDPIVKNGSWDGLLFNDKPNPLVVFGCPDTDLTIVSEQDVYICGDFNQGLAKNPESNADRRLNQYYIDGKTAVNAEGDYAYMIFYDQAGSEPHRPCYLTDASDLGSDRLPANKRERHAVAIISKGRIWFDFRYPTRVCGNEIRPFLAYELARAAYTDAKERSETIDGGSPAEAAYKKWGCRKAESSVDRDDLILAVEDQSLGTWKLTTHVKEFFEDPWGSGDHGLLDLSDYGDVKSAILAAGQARLRPGRAQDSRGQGGRDPRQALGPSREARRGEEGGEGRHVLPLRPQEHLPGLLRQVLGAGRTRSRGPASTPSRASRRKRTTSACPR